VEVSRGESVERELDRLIEKRHDQRATEEGHRPSEELWQASVERYNAERERELRAAWCTTTRRRPLATGALWRLSSPATSKRPRGSWNTNRKERRHDRNLRTTQG
jgi:hypothetical protein